MLKEIPEVGKWVVAIRENEDVTIGKEYQISGFDKDGDAYFIDDADESNYIGKGNLDCYKLSEKVTHKKPRVNIGLTGIEIDGEYYVEDPSRVKISLSVMTHPDYLLKVLDELHDDITKLLRDKYQV
jgi:hypothetical protein